MNILIGLLIIGGWIYGGCMMKVAQHHNNNEGSKATMGHHYQRDMFNKTWRG